jgi:hypothetical protein
MVTTMFKKDGKKYTGATHKMPDGSVHSGKTHTASSQKLFPTEEKTMKGMKGMKKQGLYANIHAKRKRIKEGSGETMRKVGSKGAPASKNFKQAAKTAKKRK